MKKMLITLIFLLFISLTNSNGASARDEIWIDLDGQKVIFQVPPVNDSGTILVEFRTLFEKLGYKVKWNEQTRTVEGVKDNLTINLSIGRKKATVNGKEINLEKEPRIEQGSTLVPLRFVAEASRADVEWNDTAKIVYISHDISYRLLTAAKLKDTGKMKEYLSRGANPNYSRPGDPFEYTSVDWSIIDQHREGLELLIQHGADVTKKSLIYDAIVHVKPLTKFGKDESGCLEIIKILIKAGADPLTKGPTGKAPYDLAKSDGLTQITSYLESLNDKPHETTVLMNGNKYVGVVIKGIPNGLGKLTLVDGSYYEGKFVSGKLEGQGKYVLADGSYYEGRFINGALEGQGTYVFANKNKYRGEFKQGKFNGRGAIYTALGDMIESGDYIDGVFVNILPSLPKPSGSLTTTDELKDFLEKNFSEVTTSLGTTKFTFEILEYNSSAWSYDFAIKVKYDFDFFFELFHGNKLNTDIKEKVKKELKDHQEKIGRSVVAAMPTKRMYGEYYDSWYKYPNLKVDLMTSTYYSWTNIDESYPSYEPSAFRWK
ncbi:stalk domain-containing protein [Paenibacillus sp. GbtcB18]|uniref:stalk domain-containing protein n=1 Tax=Paenibacillus sp. GbtcB18 TaxID=2824763 RepID=UPI001C3019C5|nr:stalk domain-containing protein [Paenibacillus sp. GbtcB18]